jgi:hypothetical protein
MIWAVCVILHYCLSAITFSSNAIADVMAIKQPRAMDLNYGAALYHYYQNDWYEALLTLETYDNDAMVQYHGHHPRLVKAGIMLSYGMPASAQSIIEKLLSLNASHNESPQDLTEPVAFTLSEAEIDYAQFALLKAYYEQKKYAQASLIAANFSGGEAADTPKDGVEAKGDVAVTPKDGVEAKGDVAVKGDVEAKDSGADEQPFRQELRYLQGQLQLIFHQNPQAALKILQGMDVHSTWYRYLLFNLSVYYVKQKELETAEGLLAPFISGSVANTPASKKAEIDELELLNDRLQSLWVLLLKKKGDYQSMLQALAPLHLQTGTARKLLLLYARELAENEQYSQAAQVLTFLTQQTTDSAADIEILYLQALVQEHLLDFASASTNYRNLASEAELKWRDLEQEKANLDEALLTTYLDGANLTFYTNYYQHYHSLAFQSNLKEHQTLLQLQKSITTGLKKLEVYQWVLDEKQRDWTSKASDIDKILQAQNTVDLAAERESILTNTQTNSVHLDKESLQTYARFASNQWQEQFQRLNKAKALREHFSNTNDPRTLKWDAQIKRAQGVLLWQGSENWPKNLWRHTKLVNDIEVQIRQYETNRQRLQARLKASESIASLSARLSKLTPEMTQFKQEVDNALASSGRSLKANIYDYLSAEQADAITYVKLSRIALAKMAKRKLEQNGLPGGGRKNE